MPIIKWGDALAEAEEAHPFTGFSTLSGARIVAASNSVDACVLDWWLPTNDSFTRHWYKWDDSTMLDYGAHPINLSHEGAPSLVTSPAWQGAGNIKYESWYRSFAHNDAYYYTATQGATLEVWAQCICDTAERTIIISDTTPYFHVFMRLNPSSVAGSFRAQMANSDPLLVSNVTSGWHHFAVSVDSDSARLYMDGVKVATVASPTTSVTSGTLVLSRNATNNSRYWASGLDNLAIHTTARYTGDSFYCGRYAQYGVITVNTSTALPRLISSIAWDATTGSSYGNVYQVHVNTGTDEAPIWTKVGGDYPTNPIGGLSVLCTSSKLCRLTLTPKNDALKTETPTLNSLQVEWYPVSSERGFSSPIAGGAASLSNVRIVYVDDKVKPSITRVI